MKELTSLFGGCLGILLVILVLILISPIMLYLVWNWVVVAAFIGVAKITFFQSFAICLVLAVVGSFFKNSSTKE